MKAMKILIAAMLVALFAAGAASAGTVDISSTAAVDPVTGAYILTVGDDSFAMWNLKAVYSGWASGIYNVEIREGGLLDPPGAIAYANPGALTPMPSSDFDVELHWVPTDADNGKLFTVWAYGMSLGTFKIAAQVTKPVPELNTGLLISVGLIGLVGMVRYRRKE